MGSTKNSLITFKAINAAALTADVAGPATNISFLDNLSVHIQCGAGATGQFFVQGSNVPGNGGIADNGPGTNDWVTVPLVDGAGSPVTLVVSGSAVDFLVNIQGLACAFLRVIYTFTSGAGTASAWVNGKSL